MGLVEDFEDDVSVSNWRRKKTEKYQPVWNPSVIFRIEIIVVDGNSNTLVARKFHTTLGHGKISSDRTATGSPVTGRTNDTGD